MAMATSPQTALTSPISVVSSPPSTVTQKTIMGSTMFLSAKIQTKLTQLCPVEKICISNATAELRNRCPNQKEAVLWYDDCMFRYSNAAIKAESFHPNFNMSDKNNVLNVSAFNSALDTLPYNLTNRAASGSSLRKFAKRTATAPPSYTIYALVQCIPYLSQQLCSHCLSQSFTQIPACCNRKQGGRVAGTSCNLRFETYSFYNASADGPSSLQPPPATILSPPSNSTTLVPRKAESTLIMRQFRIQLEFDESTVLILLQDKIRIHLGISSL
ncbi:hypothetical protein SLEP1_g49720 [Rubroshorea leprosula]|uniref:Gnk2-homologous domain-containing protein n=1 Tax=Rubroshorea leprosula TaxID=152421 RepID=A0AAV5M0S7_9ROSI|nr:hypothetical protein SLEP1_g49720 [Rubroshorea leprosula]